MVRQTEYVKYEDVLEAIQVYMEPESSTRPNKVNSTLRRVKDYIANNAEKIRMERKE